MPAQTNASLPESLEVGGYRIVKKISSGGFSIVYLATLPFSMAAFARVKQRRAAAA